MKKIKLTKEKFAIVDDKDFEYLSQWKWYLGSWYAQRNVTLLDKPKINNRYLQKTLLMHREIMGDNPGHEIDHINRNKLDNRRSNLRWTTPSQNKQNTIYRLPASGIRGVYRHTKNTWVSFITANNKRFYLGNFNTKEAAEIAYNKAVKKYHGKYSHVET